MTDPAAPDFEAEVTLHPVGASSRKGTLPSTYGCPLDLGLDNLSDARHVFEGDLPVTLGSTRRATVKLLDPDGQVGRLDVGMRYRLWEFGWIGEGQITRVLDERLRRGMDLSGLPT